MSEQADLASVLDACRSYSDVLCYAARPHFLALLGNIACAWAVLMLLLAWATRHPKRWLIGATIPMLDGIARGRAETQHPQPDPALDRLQPFPPRPPAG